MKKQSRSAGFGAVEIILIVVIVGLLAFLGYYVYTQQNKPTPADNQSTQQTSTNSDQAAPAPTNDGYVEIKEWGVKVALRDYEKVQFTVGGGSDEHPTLGAFEGVATPVFRAEFLQDKTCEPGLSMYRSKTTMGRENVKKIGEYYYTITGGPGRCSDNSENPDEQLKSRFLADFKLDNVTSAN